MTISETNNNPALPKQPYKYRGIELERHFGLETYETFYRGHDPQIGRFNSVDPKSEFDNSNSPFVSMRNDPVVNIDPFGDEAIASTHTDEKGRVLAVYNDGDLGVYRHEKNADGSSATKAQIDKRHESSTSAGGEKMGETEYWDEFVNFNTHKPEGTIVFLMILESIGMNYCIGGKMKLKN